MGDGVRCALKNPDGVERAGFGSGPDAGNRLFDANPACAATIFARSSSGLVFGATPARWASVPRPRRSRRNVAHVGEQGQQRGVRLQRRRVRAQRLPAATIIPSVTRVAPEATIPSPTAGKM